MSHKVECFDGATLYLRGSPLTAYLVLDSHLEDDEVTWAGFDTTFSKTFMRHRLKHAIRYVVTNRLPPGLKLADEQSKEAIALPANALVVPLITSEVVFDDSVRLTGGAADTSPSYSASVLLEHDWRGGNAFPAFYYDYYGMREGFVVRGMSKDELMTNLRRETTTKVLAVTPGRLSEAVKAFYMNPTCVYRSLAFAKADGTYSNILEYLPTEKKLLDNFDKVKAGLEDYGRGKNIGRLHMKLSIPHISPAEYKELQRELELSVVPGVKDIKLMMSRYPSGEDRVFDKLRDELDTEVGKDTLLFTYGDLLSIGEKFDIGESYAISQRVVRQ
jgi:hypothetical protein